MNAENQLQLCKVPALVAAFWIIKILAVDRMKLAVAALLVASLWRCHRTREKLLLY